MFLDISYFNKSKFTQKWLLVNDEYLKVVDDKIYIEFKKELAKEMNNLFAYSNEHFGSTLACEEDFRFFFQHNFLICVEKLSQLIKKQIEHNFYESNANYNLIKTSLPQNLVAFYQDYFLPDSRILGIIIDNNDIILMLDSVQACNKNMAYVKLKLCLHDCHTTNDMDKLFNTNIYAVEINLSDVKKFMFRIITSTENQFEEAIIYATNISYEIV